MPHGEPNRGVNQHRAGKTPSNLSGKVDPSFVDLPERQLCVDPLDPTEDGITQFTLRNPLNGKSVVLTTGVLKDYLRIYETSDTPDITRINVALRWQGAGDKADMIRKYELG